MNSRRRFFDVYAAVEGVHDRVPTALEMERAWRRYLQVTGQEALP